MKAVQLERVERLSPLVIKAGPVPESPAHRPSPRFQGDDEEKQVGKGERDSRLSHSNGRKIGHGDRNPPFGSDANQIRSNVRREKINKFKQ